PSWTVTWHRRNIFTDPDVVAAEAEYLRTLAAALADRPNFLGMTVGNEINQFSGAPHPDPDPIAPAQAESWLRRMLAACQEGAPDHPHVHAEYDAAWYLDDHPFTPAQCSRLGAASVIHSWVFNGTAQKYGTHSTATGQHAAYLIELSKAFADDPHRPVWLQEIGAPVPHIPPAYAADFAETAITAALDCPDVWGVTWWCSHDVDRRLADFPELEYSLGLLTNDRTAKDLGRRIAELARAQPARPKPRTTALVIGSPGAGDPAGPPKPSDCAPGGPVFEAFMRLTEDGVRPTTVLAERAADAEHLAARGISEVVAPGDVT
ncbi:MAG: hypothetical protein QOF98_100, partial [Streptomyces sp.]|nr:hypothetical protein [Streptomyces sp.]